MKAKLVLDQFADVSALTDEQRTQIVFKPGYRGRLDAVFPAGTEFSGEDALRLCKTGQAAPSDDECSKKLGWTAAQLAAAQTSYKMDTLGINRKEDRELYMAGVIAGYDEKLNYIPGQNWNAYNKAKTEAASSEDEI